ncbi:MAG: hypothetical protein BZY75_04315 [SAR202 cluster bacterium Io17-Chloro-G7]|nr:MAG: hypothetical protein BZY75_04315 [SAR202 cluster bacterium Io17-Chloro-G7]
MSTTVLGAGVGAEDAILVEVGSGSLGVGTAAGASAVGLATGVPVAVGTVGLGLTVAEVVAVGGAMVVAVGTAVSDEISWVLDGVPSTPPPQATRKINMAMVIAERFGYQSPHGEFGRIIAVSILSQSAKSYYCGLSLRPPFSYHEVRRLVNANL